MSSSVSSSGRATPRSEELYGRAVEVLPGGVNSPVRAMRSIGRDPIFIARAEGSKIWDEDGNRYVDWVCSWGPLILGHAEPSVLAAIEQAAGRGTTYGAPTVGEIEIAEEVAARVPSVEMIRMTSSGTEAAMGAIRLARAATGREALVKFAGAYHGHTDGLLVEAGSGMATAGVPSSPGVPEAVAAQTTIVPWNDAGAVERALSERPVAALLVEPLPANMGVVPPEANFLQTLRELADAHGAVLVFDEVISGFRVAPGGAQQLYGVEPDVTAFGKVIGGGLPAAAFGGSREMMERIAPAGDVYQAGTLSGNPLAVAAGLAALRQLDAEAYERIGATTERLAFGLREAAEGFPVQVASAPGLVTPFFTEAPVRDFDGASACDLEAYARFARAMIDRGIYPPASQFEAWFPSLAHSDEDVEVTIGSAREAFTEAFARG